MIAYGLDGIESNQPGMSYLLYNGTRNQSIDAFTSRFVIFNVQ